MMVNDDYTLMRDTQHETGLFEATNSETCDTLHSDL